MPNLPHIVLRPGREKSVRNRHPWVFSGAVEHEPDDLEKGQVVYVDDAEGNVLGSGTYNADSQIRVRLFTFADEEIDATWFSRKVQNAEQWRKQLLPPNTNAFRVLSGEADGVPGLIVDRYGDGLVVTLATAGADFLRQPIIDGLVTGCRPEWILERSSGGYRREENVPPRVAEMYGEVPEDPVQIVENGLKFLVDIRAGQKTGFFLDQRAARYAAMKMAGGRTVLNAFGYTGGFGVYAKAGDAGRTVTVDLNRAALDLAAKNHELNQQRCGEDDFVCMDVFDFLRVDETRFDMIILDPPAFAKSKAALNRATRGYKDINLLAMRRLPPGGLLFTFSCSGHVNLELHRKVLFGAALDAGRNVQILRIMGQEIDHPINVYHPEGEYLTGFICRVE
ncbi:MAG: class I SAM-dependent rRNA methyltransferase [Candidatus Lernaella stagnicola]|nr:class I SAM-dependent rRNA methyltransferase [Candidatus Lernaella stagnicola]